MGLGGQVLNHPSFVLSITCLSSAAQVLLGCSGFLAAIFTRAANTCERQNVCQSSVLAGRLAVAEQSFWFPRSLCTAGSFFFYYYFLLSSPENVISACFCQSKGALCSLEWGSGPLKRTGKWQAQRHQCVCGPERDV